MKTFCIKTQADLAQIPDWDAIQLEIYLPNAMISLPEINGNCLIRAENCQFPHLETVHGRLSIDAAGAFLPKLQRVEGDCNVHEPNILLPKLNYVKGKLKILEPIDLSALEKVGNKLENKAKVPLPKLISTHKRFIEIKNKTDVAHLPADGYFSLLISADDITIEHPLILGNISIRGSNIQFPNLVEAQKILIGTSNQRNIIHNITFPSLIKIHENCIICKADNVFFPILNQIGNKLLLDGSTGFFYNLEQVAIFNYNSSAKPSFPKLKWVKERFYCSELSKSHQDANSFPVLESVVGRLRFSPHLIFPNLKKIGILELVRVLGERVDYHFPKLETIQYAVYDVFLGQLASKVEHLFLGITENIYVSSTEFIMNSRWSSILIQQRFPLSTLISILKMRHSSFQNFYTREFERIWAKPHEKIQEVAQTIEKKWNRTSAFTFKDLFALPNRNLRRFSFLYIGVSEMMKALEAQRIAAKGIELNYFKYDSSGNKVPFTKHNIFEIYEASVEKLQDLNTWRSRNEKIYAVKCWCTSTNHEHWLWIEAQYKTDPLAAIASTFRIHENVIPHIKCLKRQGDVLICEMQREVIPSGVVRPLTKKEYFGLLEVET